MASDPIYPFGLPGMNHLAGSSQGNPLATSLELMRNAMSSFGQSASLAGGSMAQSLNPEDLERRIAELKVVENWLRLNLSMLGSSIQGMEVQLATIKTLRSFVEMGSQTKSADDQQPSPLEIVLGLKKPAAHASRRQQAEKPSAAETRQQEPPWSGQTHGAQGAFSGSPSGMPESAASEPPQSSQPSESPASDDANTAAAKAWWDMLQSQFSQLAAATAQATKFAQTTGQESESPPANASRPSAAKKTVAKAASSKASPPKTRARKTSSRKTNASRTGKST